MKHWWRTVLLMMCSVWTVALASEPGPVTLQGQAVAMVTRWALSTEREPLIAAVIVKSDTTRLQVFRSNGKRLQKLGDWVIGDIPLNLMTTREQDGYLVTQWITGSGYVTKIFAYGAARATIVDLIEVGAKGLPDLILSPTDEYDFAMMVRTDKQGVAGRGGPSDDATIFKLKAGTEISRTVVPWEHRFGALIH